MAVIAMMLILPYIQLNIHIMQWSVFRYRIRLWYWIRLLSRFDIDILLLRQLASICCTLQCFYYPCLLVADLLIGSFTLLTRLSTLCGVSTSQSTCTDLSDYAVYCDRCHTQLGTRSTLLDTPSCQSGTQNTAMHSEIILGCHIDLDFQRFQLY